MNTTQEQILEAADSLFGEAGFDAVSTRQIAERSGVNKALIHYHFRNKSLLFSAVLERYYEKLDEVLRRALLSDLPHTSARERLVAVIDGYVDFLAEHRGFSRMVQREAAGGGHLEQIAARMVPLFRLGRDVLEGAFPTTRGGDLDAAQLLVSFYGMVVATFTYAPVLGPLMDVDPMSDEGIARRKAHLVRMAEMLMEALT